MGNLERLMPEEPDSGMRSRLGSAGGHGSMREKRRSIAEEGKKIIEIFRILPHDSQRRIGNRVEQIIRSDNRNEAIEILRNEVAAQIELIKLYETSISPDEALDELDKMLNKKEKVQ